MSGIAIFLEGYCNVTVMEGLGDAWRISELVNVLLKSSRDSQIPQLNKSSYQKYIAEAWPR